TPLTMQEAPRYENNLDELVAFFDDRLNAAARAGIARDRMVLDPGIGFGKTLEHNLAILRGLSRLKVFGLPILVGISRKSFVGRLMSADLGHVPPPEQRLEGTLAATLWAIQEGACGVRVHDVAPTRRAIAVWNSLGRLA